MTVEVAEAPDTPKKAIAKGLYSKLAEVMAEVGRVPKNGYNDFHKYKYVREDDLVEAVRDALSSRGVALLPSAVGVEKEGNLSTVRVTFTFVDGESGEVHKADWFGTGDDKGDKGLYKAYTGAIKYFLMKSFLIPTGDDPEGDPKTDKRAGEKKKPPAQANGKPPSISKKDAENLRDGVVASGVDTEKVQTKLTALGVSKLDELTSKQADELFAWVQDETEKA